MKCQKGKTGKLQEEFLMSGSLERISKAIGVPKEM